MSNKNVLLDALKLIRSGVQDAIDLIEETYDEVVCKDCGLTLCECYVEAWNASEGSALTTSTVSSWDTGNEVTEDEDECPFCGSYCEGECDEDVFFESDTKTNVWNTKTGIWSTEE